MSSAVLEHPETPGELLHHVETLGDLLERLGGISAQRVRFIPPPGAATEEDLILLNARKDGIFELIDGVLVEKAMAYWESRLAVVLIVMLENFLDDNDLGLVTGADGMMRLTGRRVRIPDIGFVAWDQFPGRNIPDAPIPDLHPDLAVEVLSKSNTPGEMRIKRQDYFNAGTRLVWHIDPGSRTVRVYTAVEDYQEFNEDDLIEVGDVLPEFSFTLRDVFKQARRER